MKHKTTAAALALLAAMAVLLGVWYTARPETSRGTKHLTIQVVHGDSTTREYAISTDAEYLAEALTEQGLAAGEQGPYGLFIKTVDGETADSAAQQWWCFTRGGETVYNGADSTPIADGETYELTLMTGYDN